MIGNLLPLFFSLGGQAPQRYGINKDKIEDLIGQPVSLKTFIDRKMPIDTDILKQYHNFSTDSRGKLKKISLFDLINYIDEGKICGSDGEYPKEFHNYQLLEENFQRHQREGGNNSSFLSDPNNLSWPVEKYESPENFAVLHGNYSDEELDNSTELFKKIALDPVFRKTLNLHHTPEKTVKMLQDMRDTGYNLNAPFVVKPLNRKQYGIIDGGHRVSNLLFLANHGFIPKDDLKNYPISFIKMLPQLMNFANNREREL